MEQLFITYLLTGADKIYKLELRKDYHRRKVLNVMIIYGLFLAFRDNW